MISPCISTKEYDITTCVNDAIELSIKNGAIKAGQVWSFLCFEDNPFKENKKMLLKILNIQDGFIEYQYINGGCIDSLPAIGFVKVCKFEK